MKKTGILILLAMAFQTGTAQLVVSFDFSNIEQTVAFFKKPAASKEDIDLLLASPGVKTIIKKIRSTDSIARIALEKVSKGIKPAGKENDFQYYFIKEHLQELEDFTKKINANRQVILDSINALSAYLPANKQMPVKVVFLAGGILRVLLYRMTMFFISVPKAAVMSLPAWYPGVVPVSCGKIGVGK
ncbi:MAG: hypothetical protein H7Y86_10260 [Rhizobacter sp.]|nr:hypothetical protein [Ferruginibacter sp.]